MTIPFLFLFVLLAFGFAALFKFAAALLGFADGFETLAFEDSSFVAH